MSAWRKLRDRILSRSAHYKPAAWISAHARHPGWPLEAAPDLVRKVLAELS